MQEQIENLMPPPPSSLVMLAQCYIHGTDGFTKDEEKGVGLLMECAGEDIDTASRDDASDDLPVSTFECMSLLGTLYLWGDHGVEQDVDAAERLLKPAAKAGQAFASYGLGMMWFLGFRNNTDRNFRVAADYLSSASRQGYLLAHSYVGGMYLSGAGHGPEVDPETGETVRVNTLVEVDLDKAAEHFNALVLEGGPWGDPDATIELARKFQGNNLHASEIVNRGAEMAAISYEMKALLGYEEAAVSAGYLWYQIAAKGTVSEELAVDANDRSERWWRSTADHHPQSRAAVHSLLFVGDKLVERGDFEGACDTYADGLQVSSSARGLAQAKALGLIGWHLLLGRDCSATAREKLSQMTH